MELYFVRHAHAQEGHGIDDHDRQLTAQGLNAAQALATLLVKVGVKPTVLYSSPRVRATQTAEIIAQMLGLKVEIREDANFGLNVPAVQRLTADLKAQAVVMLVGHEPSLSATIGEIIAGTSPARVQMKKSGLARIEITSLKPLRGELVWLLAPRVVSAGSVMGGLEPE